MATWFCNDKSKRFFEKLLNLLSTAAKPRQSGWKYTVVKEITESENQ